MWCIPPKEDARFVAAMEDVLEVYERPYDPRRPVVCLDEAARQVLQEVREPLAMEPGQVERFDNEYERDGTCALFMLFEPLASWREGIVKERRTQVDYAQVVRYLCDEKYPDAEVIVLMQDNLNIRPKGTRGRGACIRLSSRKKPKGWCNGSSGITRPSTAVGSTWPRLN